MIAAVITEQAVLDVKPGSEAEFEAAFERAKAIVVSMPGFQALRLLRCLEAPHRYLLLVEWQRFEDHTVGFRGSTEYEEWKALLHHFYDPFPVVEHFTLVSEGSPGGAHAGRR
jgi:heme-degrading monooxygenase HmoA